jgi:hypothetical protein
MFCGNNENSFGELAQLARAPALQAGGHRFDSDILHNFKPYKVLINNIFIGFFILQIMNIEQGIFE